MRRNLCRALVLLLPLSTFASPQANSPSQSAAPAPAPRGSDRQITLDVRVTDKSGAPIQGLQQQDFTLLDNNHPQSIASFAAVETAAPTNPPVEVLVAIDAINVPFVTVGFERSQIRSFLVQNGGELAHPLSLLAFSSDGTKVVKDASTDGNAIAAAYDQFQTGLRDITRSQGVYGAQDRFNLSLSSFHSMVSTVAAVPGRKLLIWISAGWPLLSGPRIELSPQTYQQLFDAIVATSSELIQNRVTVYSVDPLGMADSADSQYYTEFVKGVTSPSHTQPGNLALQVLAVQSGGRVINDTNDLSAAIANCVADANSYYALSFNTAPSEHPNEYHSLAVKIDKPGATARTRTGYYAQP
jgi:VWFA-related protein